MPVMYIGLLVRLEYESTSSGELHLQCLRRKKTIDPLQGKKHPNIHSIVCNLHDFTWFELRRTPATLRLHHFAKDLRQAALGLRSTSHLCKAAYHEVVRRTPDAVAPPIEVVRILRSDVITEDMVFVMHCGCVNFT